MLCLLARTSFIRHLVVVSPSSLFVMIGYLQVLTADVWILRYFALEGDLLVEYQNEQKPLKMRPLPLAQCTVVVHALHKYKPFAFSVRLDAVSTIVLLADTSLFRDKWIQQLQSRGYSLHTFFICYTRYTRSSFFYMSPFVLF